MTRWTGATEGPGASQVYKLAGVGPPIFGYALAEAVSIGFTFGMSCSQTSSSVVAERKTQSFQKPSIN